MGQGWGSIVVGFTGHTTHERGRVLYRANRANRAVFRSIYTLRNIKIVVVGVVVAVVVVVCACVCRVVDSPRASNISLQIISLTQADMIALELRCENCIGNACRGVQRAPSPVAIKTAPLQPTRELLQCVNASYCAATRAVGFVQLTRTKV